MQDVEDFIKSILSNDAEVSFHKFKYITNKITVYFIKTIYAENERQLDYAASIVGAEKRINPPTRTKVCLKFFFLWFANFAGYKLCLNTKKSYNKSFKCFIFSKGSFQ